MILTENAKTGTAAINASQWTQMASVTQANKHMEFTMTQ